MANAWNISSIILHGVQLTHINFQLIQFIVLDVILVLRAPLLFVWTSSITMRSGDQTWQTEWQTAPLAKAQLCEYENQTLKVLLWPAVCIVTNSIVQWLARIIPFWVLRVIVRLAYFKPDLTFKTLGRVLVSLFWNRNSWNEPNNCSFSGYSDSRVAVKPS